MRWCSATTSSAAISNAARPATRRCASCCSPRCTRLSRDEADAWLAARDGAAAEPSPAGIARLRKSVTRAEFDAAIDAIHAALRAGDSYQVNYTYRLGFDAWGSPPALYRRLRARQPVRYGALIALPGGRWVLSCSPELFVEKQGDAAARAADEGHRAALGRPGAPMRMRPNSWPAIRRIAPRT